MASDLSNACETAGDFCKAATRPLYDVRNRHLWTSETHPELYESVQELKRVIQKTTGLAWAALRAGDNR